MCLPEGKPSNIARKPSTKVDDALVQNRDVHIFSLGWIIREKEIRPDPPHGSSWLIPDANSKNIKFSWLANCQIHSKELIQ